MSPLDMLIFFFFILVTIKAAIESVKYWKDRDGRREQDESFNNSRRSFTGVDVYHCR